jgi:hypothetical protein
MELNSSINESNGVILRHGSEWPGGIPVLVLTCHRHEINIIIPGTGNQELIISLIIFQSRPLTENNPDFNHGQDIIKLLA